MCPHYLFPESDVRSATRETRSLMPISMPSVHAREVDDLLAYLVSRGGRRRAMKRCRVVDSISAAIGLRR